MNRYKEDRKSAILWAKKALEKPFLVIDTETTGLESYDQVLQVGLVSSSGHVILECLLNPIPAQISPSAQQVHGITQDAVDFAPTFPRLSVILADLFRNYPFYAYSAEFDQRLIEQTVQVWHLNLKVPMFRDVKEPFARFYGDWDMQHTSYRWQKLSVAAELLGIEATGFHSAAADALTTLRVMQAMAQSG